MNDVQRYVYFAERDGRIKIGCSTAPQTRALGLGAEFLGAMVGSFSTERAMHDRFDAHRVEGEWFTDVPELRDFIAALPPIHMPRYSGGNLGLHDRIHEGRLRPLLREWSNEGLSFDEMAYRLRGIGVTASRTTVRRWLRHIDEEAAA